MKPLKSDATIARKQPKRLKTVQKRKQQNKRNSKSY